MTFHDVPKPSRVTVDGIRKKDWTYVNGVLSLTVNQENTMKEMEIVIR